jgi:hypothetical protein
MVKVIDTRGFRVGMLADMEGWASSEFNEVTENLLEELEVPVPELQEPKQKHPWGLPGKKVVGEDVPGRPTVGKKKPGPKKKERRLVPAEGIRERLLAAKRKALENK